MSVSLSLKKKKNELRNDRGPGQQRAPVAALAIVFYILLPSRFFSPAVTALLHGRSPEAYAEPELVVFSPRFSWMIAVSP